jgi:nucleotide-binding universal stress UspA family protein
MVHRILLGFDGTEASSKAFDMAVEATQHYRAQLHVLVVAETPGNGDDAESASVVEHSRNHREALLRDLRYRIEQSRSQAHLEMRVGHPAQRILEHADRLQIDLIVLGHRGHGALDRWRPESVTHRVISYAKCAVLVVR